MKALTNICRVLVGLLFIFSGFIKANDTLGFSYKLEEYFEVFEMQWMISFSLFLAIFICVFEIILGFMLLLGAKIKATLWLLVLMILFFTFLTFYSAYYNKVTSCGCFGDAIPLTPWQSFIKDLILLTLIIVLFLGRSKIRPLFSLKIEKAFLMIFTVCSIAFPLYTYNYLPVIDFRPYAIGKDILKQTQGVPDVLKYYYKLKNKNTGEIKEFESWPKNWDQDWEYIDNRTEIAQKGIEPKIHDLSIMSLDGAEYTEDILSNEQYSFLLITYDLNKANRKIQDRINDFASLAQNDNFQFIALTASGTQDIKSFGNETQPKYDFYNTDGVVLKTMIRSNPGLILLKNGVVIDKWHFHSFPSFSQVKDEYLSLVE